MKAMTICHEAKSVDFLPADASQISNSLQGQSPYDGAEQIIWEWTKITQRMWSSIPHKPHFSQTSKPPKKPRQISATPINPRQQKSPLHLQHPISPHQWKSYREFAQTSNYNYNSRASGPNVHSEFPQRKARPKLPSINLTQVFEATII